MTVYRLSPNVRIVGVHWKGTIPPGPGFPPWYRLARKLTDRSGELYVGEYDQVEATAVGTSVTEMEFLDTHVYDADHEDDAYDAFQALIDDPRDYATFLLKYDPLPSPEEPSDEITDWTVAGSPAPGNGYNDGSPLLYQVFLGNLDEDGFIKDNSCPPAFYSPIQPLFRTEEHAQNSVDYFVIHGITGSTGGVTSLSVMSGGLPLSCTTDIVVHT